MNIKIQSVHFDADKKLLEFTEQRVQKLIKYYDEIIGSEIIFRIENTSGVENKIAEVKLIIAGNDLFAKKQCKSFEEAIDEAIDALKVQITKHKEKQRGQ
jgi:putative sigma-54 modulation protein